MSDPKTSDPANNIPPIYVDPGNYKYNHGCYPGSEIDRSLDASQMADEKYAFYDAGYNSSRYPSPGPWNSVACRVHIYLWARWGFFQLFDTLHFVFWLSDRGANPSGVGSHHVQPSSRNDEISQRPVETIKNNAGRDQVQSDNPSFVADL